MSALAAELSADSAVEDAYYDSEEKIRQMPVSAVPLDSLVPGFFLRQRGTDAAHVRLLADAASTAELPPIIVQRASMRVIDGLHRLAAAKLCGEENINVRFIDCADESAFILAVKSNIQHGMPLSRADRIAGAERILAWHPDWSDRALAAVTGLGTRTIVALRSRMGDNSRPGEKRLGRDGKRRPVAIGDGRKRAAEYILARPDAPLREVARETDVSLGTVHDVRMKMRSGMDPADVGRPRSAPDRAAEAPASRGTQTGSPREAVARPRGMLESPLAAESAVAPLEIFAAGAASARKSNTRPRKCALQETAWQAILSKMANDPTLRYTEAGRTFLRWMTLHAVSAGEWKTFMEAIPPRWLREISAVADNFSNEWREFASELWDKQRAAS
jgi:ParB-like chromosome segregation protein Spo0J